MDQQLFRPLAAALAFAAFSFVASPAFAQFARAEDAVKYRQSALSVMNVHLGRIGAMVNGRVPFDPQAALENAQIVATLSHLPWAGFAPETEKLSPKARPEIWTEQPKFKERSQNLVAETGQLVAAAKTQDVDKLKAAFRATAAACKACHDAFRN